MTEPSSPELQTELQGVLIETERLVETCIASTEYGQLSLAIREFIDTLRAFCRVLAGLLALLQDYRIANPVEEDVPKRRLEESVTFIREFMSHDRRRSSRSGPILVTLRRRSSRDAPNDTRAVELKNGLTVRIQKNLEFILNIALKPNLVARNSSRPINHSSRGTAIAFTFSQTFDEDLFPSMSIELLTLGNSNIKIPNHDDIARTINDLVRLRNYYDRVRNSSALDVTIRVPEDILFNSWLEWIWYRMCVIGGLTKNSQLPLRSNILDAPSRNLNESKVNLASESIHAPISIQPNDAPRFVRQAPHMSDAATSPAIIWRTPSYRSSGMSTPSPSGPSQTSTVRTTPLSPTSIHPRGSRASFSLGPPALPVQRAAIATTSVVPKKTIIATTMLSVENPSLKKKIRLGQYDIHPYGNEGAQQIIWKGESSSTQLEHYLPNGAFPQTCHKKLHPNLALRVNFLGRDHRLKLRVDDVLRDYSCAPEYEFYDAEDLKEFQETVRGKMLVKVFDFEIIWSDHYARNYNHAQSGIASKQDLKIWQNTAYPYHHSISFFASSTTDEHLEYHVDQFDNDLWEEPKENTVKLQFASYEARNPKRRSSRLKLSKLKGQLPFYKRASLPNDTAVIAADQRATSQSSYSSSQKSDGPVEHADPHKSKWIRIRFTTREGFDEFVRTFHDAYDNDHAKEPMSPPMARRLTSRAPSGEDPLPVPPTEDRNEFQENCRQADQWFRHLHENVHPLFPTELTSRAPSGEDPFPVPPTEDRNESQENCRQADQWFRHLHENVHPLFPTERVDWNTPSGPKRVRVAILDTGVKFPEFIENLYGEQLQECRDWVECDSTHDSDGKPFNWKDGQDSDGHGTHLAGLVLKVAPNVEVFVARVFRNQEELQQQSTKSDIEWRVVQAMKYAVNIWKVDIISMSFGFPEKSKQLDEAFDEATAAKPKVLMLAAAAYIRPEKLSWPAISSRAICIYNLTGDGLIPRQTPPQRDGHANFAILGYDVSSWWPDDLADHQMIRKRMSGTSVATAIAAGVAALVMEIVRQPERIREMDDFKLEKLKQLGDIDAMTEVFRAMSTTHHGYNRILPWRLLTQGNEPTTIIDNIIHHLS